MKTLPTISRAIGAIYEPETDERSWLEQVQEATNRAFEGQMATQAVSFQFTPQGRVEFRNVTGDSSQEDLMLTLMDAADVDDLRAMFFSGPVSRISDAIDASQNDKFKQFYQRAMGGAGLEVVVAIGVDPSGQGCAVPFVRPRAKMLPVTRQALSRLAGHLATAYRLRRVPGTVAASFDEKGRLVDCADRDAEHFSASLGRAALDIDRAEREASHSPDAALEHWKALVEGRWSLTTRLHADGRRLFIARENPPPMRAHKALDAAERAVVALAAIGRPAKWIAYELGSTEPEVSRRLRRALLKLGVENRQELVEVFGALADSTSGSAG